jgi:hypothetical protein
MDALRFRAFTLLSHHALLHEQSGVEVECIMLLEKILSMVDQMKKDLDMSRWMLMPKHTYEYRFYVLVVIIWEKFCTERPKTRSTRNISRELE